MYVKWIEFCIFFKKCVSWIYTINWICFLKNCILSFKNRVRWIYKIMYIIYKMCTLNVLNCVLFWKICTSNIHYWVHYLKYVHVKCTKLYTKIEKYVYFFVLNSIHSLKNMYIKCTKCVCWMNKIVESWPN